MPNLPTPANVIARNENLLVPLFGANETMLNADVVGGKAANLTRLHRLGLAVPDGWVVTTRATELWRAGRLSESAFNGLVRQRLPTTCGRRYAVRSSADTEDSGRASFAGQFRTELNVPAEQVPAAVLRVAGSLASEPARAYARRLGVPVPTAMAVLVQEQLDPVLSGVCFTAHPVTGEPVLVVEFTDGLGDTVASGGTPAGSCLMPLLPGGGVAEGSLAGLDPTTADRLREVARVALAAATGSGRPQDVEWAIDRHGLWLLQARPITTIGGGITVPVSTRSES